MTSNSSHDLSGHGRFVILFASAMTIMATATIAPSLPGLQAYFANVEDIEAKVRLILTLPSLAVAITAPLFGLVIDRLGRKPILIGAIVLYAVAGVSGFFAEDVGLILLGRALLGVSKAALLTVCTALVADYFQGAAMRSFMGVQAAAIKIGGVVLIFTAGFLAEIGWRWPFLLYGAILVTLVGAISEIRETRGGSEARALAQDGTGWTMRAAALIVGLSLLAAAGQAIFYQLPLELPFLIMGPLGGRPYMIGLALSLTALVAGGAGLGYGALRARFGFNLIFAATFASFAAGAWMVSAATSFPVLYAGLAVFGVGVGLIIPNVTVWAVETAPRRSTGLTISLITSATFLGQFGSTYLLSPIAELYGAQTSFMVIAAGSLAASLAFTLPALRNARQA